MENPKVIFMGTPQISKLYLLSLINNNFNIIGIYTQSPKKKGRGMQLNNSPVSLLAKEKDIPVFCPDNFNDISVLENFKKLKPDLVVVMAYGFLLPKKILNIPKYGFINIHVSLLPRWRGASPIEYAILNGDKTTGVSIFKIQEQLDTGPIIASKEIEIEAHESRLKLTEKLNLEGVNLLLNTLPKIFKNNVQMINQDDSRATYSQKINSNFRKINFNRNVLEVYNHIRAFSPEPAAWFLYNNERIKIIKSSMESCVSQSSHVLNKYFHIGCKNGKIIPKIVQREGKKPMSIEEFLKGFKFEINKRINE